MLKNVTLSAESSLVEKGRLKAKAEKKSLNLLFRQWLARYAGGENQARGYREIMDRLQYARPGKHFSRDEMNER